MGRAPLTSFMVREEHSELVWNWPYEHEQFIQKLLNANKQQATLHKFLNKFCCFYTCKIL
jgi:hypothetical protein